MHRSQKPGCGLVAAAATLVAVLLVFAQLGMAPAAHGPALAACSVLRDGQTYCDPTATPAPTATPTPPAGCAYLRDGSVTCPPSPVPSPTATPPAPGGCSYLRDGTLVCPPQPTPTPTPVGGRV